jgi:HipA-like protein
MKNKIKNIFKKLTPWSVDKEFVPIGDNTENGKFELLFENKVIGTLEYFESKWTFKYSDEYKKNKYILPLVNFPDIDKVYKFEELVPFFATRIPNLNQPFHQKKIEKHNGDKNNLVSLLKIFGEKSINNPFELKYS